jgi:uncharacterized OsmC-like protein
MVPPSDARGSRPGNVVEVEMADQAQIRAIVERNIELLALKPSRGRLTRTTKARLQHGVRCEIEEGSWKFAADLPAKVGGEDSAPTPGALGRGALASCLAIGIAVWAARLEVPIEGLEVEVQTDFDARGELGMGVGVDPGYAQVRYQVSIESRARKEDVDAVVGLAERHSPYLDVFGRAMDLRRALLLNGVEA